MRVYTVDITGTTTAAAFDFFELLAAAAGRYALLGIHIGKILDTVVTRYNVTLTRKASGFTSGSGGATPSAVPADSGDSATTMAGIETGNTTPASGTSVVLADDAFDPVAGYDMVPPSDDERFRWGASQGLVFKCVTTPTTSLAFNGYVVYAEL